MRYLIVILMGICLFSCAKENESSSISQLSDENSILEVPAYFPKINFPPDNEFSNDRWELGKKLFFESKLSIDNSISCANCHKVALSFSDSLAFSQGVGNSIGSRNAPSLANVAYHPYFMREGGVPTLEMQVLVPIQEHNEFNHNIVNIVDSLTSDSIYLEMSRKAYGRELDPFVITRAIACFERSLISGYSRFDRFHYLGESSSLSNSEKEGMSLFFSSKTDCASCHSDFNFSNYAFENNGLDSIYQDLGRMRLTSKEEDRAKFKVPSLRNISLTAPYMHDGRFKSLDEVLEHYNSGGKNHSNKSSLIRPLNLSQAEIDNIIAFLNSLTDEEFVGDERWKQ